MKRRRVAEDTRVFSDVISNGLYIVFEWIAQRRREAIEQLRQYNENMIKSMMLPLRRIRMNWVSRNWGATPSDEFPVFSEQHWGSHWRRLFFGVRGITRSGRYIQAPNHAKALGLYNLWIRRVTAYQDIVNQDGESSLVLRPYYLPGL